MTINELIKCLENEKRRYPLGGDTPITFFERTDDINSDAIVIRDAITFAYRPYELYPTRAVYHKHSHTLAKHSHEIIAGVELYGDRVPASLTPTKDKAEEYFLDTLYSGVADLVQSFGISLNNNSSLVSLADKASTDSTSKVFEMLDQTCDKIRDMLKSKED